MEGIFTIKFLNNRQIADSRKPKVWIDKQVRNIILWVSFFLLRRGYTYKQNGVWGDNSYNKKCLVKQGMRKQVALTLIPKEYGFYTLSLENKGNYKLL